MKHALALPKTLVLVGLMGAGKTTIGRRLAKELAVPFKDSDDEICQSAGCSIPDIFEIHGETIFRDLERRVIHRLLLEEPPHVLATGGGAWMDKKNRKLIQKHAVSVWLKADLDVLVERVSRRHTRPLLEKGDKHAILAKLMEERYPVYSEAMHHVISDHASHAQVVSSIIEIIKEHHS